MQALTMTNKPWTLPHPDIRSNNLHNELQGLYQDQGSGKQLIDVNEGFVCLRSPTECNIDRSESGERWGNHMVVLNEPPVEYGKR